MYKVYTIKDNEIIEVKEPVVGEWYFDKLGQTVEYKGDNKYTVELSSPLNKNFTIDDLDSKESIELFIRLYKKNCVRH